MHRTRGGTGPNGGQAGGHAEGADGVVPPPLGPAAGLVQAPDADNRETLQPGVRYDNRLWSKMGNNDHKIQKHSHSMASNSDLFWDLCLDVLLPRTNGPEKVRVRRQDGCFSLIRLQFIYYLIYLYVMLFVLTYLSFLFSIAAILLGAQTTLLRLGEDYALE